MKYVILIYSNQELWKALPPEEAERVIGDHFTMIRELTESGELVTQFGLADPSNGTIVRHTGAAPVVTDGPFSEAKEQLLGVFVVDSGSLDRVVEIATPLAQHSVVEIRPLMVEAGTEM